MRSAGGSAPAGVGPDMQEEDQGGEEACADTAYEDGPHQWTIADLSTGVDLSTAALPDGPHREGKLPRFPQPPESEPQAGSKSGPERIRRLLRFVVALNLAALALFCIGISSPKWSAYLYVDEREGQRLKHVGLFQESVWGRCADEECLRMWEWDRKGGNLRRLQEECREFRRRESGDEEEPSCEYVGGGGCSCPLNDDWSMKRSQAGGNICAESDQAYGDARAKSLEEYGEKMKRARESAVSTLIIAALFSFFSLLAVICALLFPSPKRMWILGCTSALFLSVALVFATSGVVTGTNFVRLRYLSPTCGSYRTLVDRNQQGQSFNGFSVGPSTVVGGIWFLTLALFFQGRGTARARSLQKKSVYAKCDSDPSVDKTNPSSE